MKKNNKKKENFEEFGFIIDFYKKNQLYIKLIFFILSLKMEFKMFKKPQTTNKIDNRTIDICDSKCSFMKPSICKCQKDDTINFHFNNIRLRQYAKQIIENGVVNERPVNEIVKDIEKMLMENEQKRYTHFIESSYEKFR